MTSPITPELAAIIPEPVDLATANEAQLRAAHLAAPKNIADLSLIISQLVNRPHDYGTSAHAMSLAAYAAFEYVAGQVGATGFQGSCADMDFLRRTRRLAGPFTIIDIEKVLYPQYDVVGQLSSFIDECAPWILEQVQAKLAEYDAAREMPVAAPHVAAHWRALVENGGKLPKPAPAAPAPSDLHGAMGMLADWANDRAVSLQTANMRALTYNAVTSVLDAANWLANEYKVLADSGDAGNWAAEDQPAYKKLREALKNLDPGTFDK